MTALIYVKHIRFVFSGRQIMHAKYHKKIQAAELPFLAKKSWNLPVISFISVMIARIYVILRFLFSGRQMMHSKHHTCICIFTYCSVMSPFKKRSLNIMSVRSYNSVIFVWIYVILSDGQMMQEKSHVGIFACCWIIAIFVLKTKTNCHSEPFLSYSYFDLCKTL